MRFFHLLSFATCLNFLKADQFNSALLYKNGSVQKLGIACDGPADIAIFGNTGYICNRWGNFVSVIDLSSNTLIKKIKSSQLKQPYNIAVDQSTAFITTQDNIKTLFAVDLDQNLFYDYSAKFPTITFNPQKPLILGNFLFVLASKNGKSAVCKIDISDIANPILVKTLNFPIQNNLSFTAYTQTLSADKTQVFFGGTGLDELSKKDACLLGIVDLDLNFISYIANFNLDNRSTSGGLVAISDTKLYGCSNNQIGENFPVKNSFPIVKIDLINQTITQIPIPPATSSSLFKTSSFQSNFSGLYSLNDRSLNQQISTSNGPSFYSGYSLVFDQTKNIAYVANMGPKRIYYNPCKRYVGDDSGLFWQPTKDGGGGQGENILIIDASNDAIINSIQGFNAPQAMALTPSGSLYICDGSAGALSCTSSVSSFSMKKLN